jgi:hypothetical protein
MSDEPRMVQDHIELDGETGRTLAEIRAAVVAAGGDPDTAEAWSGYDGVVVEFTRPETDAERVEREARAAERAEAVRRWREEHPGQEPPSWGRIVNGAFAELDARVVVSAERPKDATEGTVWIQS